MPDLTKIATCSYCGTRSILRLNNAAVHELSCARCGAPKHEMKVLKAAAPKKPVKREPMAVPQQFMVQKPKPAKRKKKSRRKRRSFDFDIFKDLLEDVVDEIFD